MHGIGSILGCFVVARLPGGEVTSYRTDCISRKQPGPLKKFLFWPLAADSLLFEFKKISV